MFSETPLLGQIWEGGDPAKEDAKPPKSMLPHIPTSNREQALTAANFENTKRHFVDVLTNSDLQGSSLLVVKRAANAFASEWEDLKAIKNVSPLLGMLNHRMSKHTYFGKMRTPRQTFSQRLMQHAFLP